MQSSTEQVRARALASLSQLDDSGMDMRNHGSMTALSGLSAAPAGAASNDTYGKVLQDTVAALTRRLSEQRATWTI